MERGVGFPCFPSPSRQVDVIEGDWDWDACNGWMSRREKEIGRKREVRIARELERQRDVRMAAAAKEEMKGVLRAMDRLPGRISDLLRSERGHAGLSVLARRGFVFTETELSSLVAALRQLLASAERIGPGHVDSQTVNHCAYLIDLARWIDDLIDGYAPDKAETELRELNLAWIEQLLLVTDAPPAAPDVVVDVGPPSILVGIDVPRKKLARWLTASDDGEAQLKVLSVVGPAGMGKTTLAMDVFRQIEGQFQCRAVARLSARPPHNDKLLRHIMSQITGSQADAATLDGDDCALAYDIKQYLQTKRYCSSIPSI